MVWRDELCEFCANKMFVEIFMPLICDDWWCGPYLRTCTVGSFFMYDLWRLRMEDSGERL